MSLEKFNMNEVENLKKLQFSKVTDSEYVDKTNKDAGVVITALKTSDGYVLINEGVDSSQEEFESFEEMFAIVQK